MSGAVLVLEDGRLFEGRAVGASGTTFGEVVFNTGMSGYQETLTDPSYHGQIVVMTAAHVGNYGLNDEDVESSGAFPAPGAAPEERAGQLELGEKIRRALEKAGIEFTNGNAPGVRLRSKKA